MTHEQRMADVAAGIAQEAAERAPAPVERCSSCGLPRGTGWAAGCEACAPGNQPRNDAVVDVAAARHGVAPETKEQTMNEAEYDEMQADRDVVRGTAPMVRHEPAPMTRRPEAAAEVTTDMPVRQSRTTEALEMALASAWLEFPTLKKSRPAEITKGSTTYTYQYVSLPDVYEAVGPTLRKHQIAPTFRPTRGHIVCRLFHVPSGQWVEGDLPVPPTDARLGVQAIGGAITYQQRRLLCAMLGLVLEDDDDGALATAAAKMPPALRDDARQLAGEPGGRLELLARMKGSRVGADIQRAALALFDEVVAEIAGKTAA
jgi:hypothetical protein